MITRNTRTTREERNSRMTRALETLAHIERSGVLANPHTAEKFGDVRGVPGGGGTQCAVARFVNTRTGLYVVVHVNSAGGYWCVDLDDGARVRVPSALNDLIYDFDHGKRPWLYLDAEEM